MKVSDLMNILDPEGWHPTLDDYCLRLLKLVLQLCL